MCSSQNKTKLQLNYAYTLNGEILEVVGEQKDLGITICDNLKPSTHIKYITTKANQRIGLIKQCFESRSDLKLSITPIESVPLEQRRLEADLCEVYKYLTGLNRSIFSTNVAAI